MPEDGDLSDELVCVYQANAVEADMVGSLLEGSGIQVAVHHSGIGAYPMTVGSLGGGRVLVRGEDEARAREIIAAAGDGDLELEEEAETPTRSWVWGLVLAAIAIGLAVMLFWTNVPKY